MEKTNKVNENYDSLPRTEKDIIRNAGAGVAYDAVRIADAEHEGNIVLKKSGKKKV